MLLTEPRISKPAAAWREWEGQLADHFLLTQLLGSRGSSAVFLTTRANGEPAAIKLVLPEDDEATARLLRLWEQAKGIEHPNLARIFEHGRARIQQTPLLYVVTEYAAENLGQILPERALSPQETREMLGPVLAALGDLHHKGFAHAHIKPNNVLAIGEQLKLAADALCRFGTPAEPSDPSVYDAPELPQSTPTAAADIWSLGVMLREALTQNADLPLTAPFAQIVRGCLERQPERRWTLAQIAAALEPEKLIAKPPAPAPSAREAEPVRAETQPAFLRSSSRHRDEDKVAARRRALLLGAVAALVLLLIFTGRALYHRPATKATTAAASAPLIASPTDVVAQSSATPATPSPSAADQAATHQVLPDVPHAAAATIHGTIKVRVGVEVDSSGRVINAKLVRPGSSKYFAKLALAAAQDWTFAPGASSSTHTVQFEFRHTGTQAHLVD